MVVGVTVLFLYVQLMLGKFNFVEQRVRYILFGRWVVVNIIELGIFIVLTDISIYDGNRLGGHGYFRLLRSLFGVRRLLWTGPFDSAVPLAGHRY